MPQLSAHLIDEKESMKKNKFLSFLCGNFFLDYQTKYALSLYFYWDSNDWYKFYLLTKEDKYQRLSFQAKRFIALRMCIECLLKAIIISLSARSESAGDAYETIRKKGSHKLLFLQKAAQIRSKKKYKICTKATLERLKTLDSLSINIRYDVDFKVQYKQQTGKQLLSESGPIFNTVLSMSYHDLLLSDIKYLNNKLSVISEKRFKKHKRHSADKMGQIEDYMKRII